MQITCPICGTELEFPDNLPEGQHLQCPDCAKKFVIHAGIATPLTYFAKKHTDVKPIDLVPKIPGLTTVGLVIIYITYSLAAFFSNTNLISVLCCATVIAFAIVAHRGKNWSRIVVTSLIGVMIAVSFLALLFVPRLRWLFFFVILLYALPIVFLWLPCSNRWYRAKKAAK